MSESLLGKAPQLISKVPSSGVAVLSTTPSFAVTPNRVKVAGAKFGRQWSAKQVTPTNCLILLSASLFQPHLPSKKRPYLRTETETEAPPGSRAAPGEVQVANVQRK